MLKFGCRASTEDIPTDTLLREIKLAENVGFDFVVVADHFHPWFHSHGRASHGWVVMSVAAAKTERIELGTGATTPTFRYHPAIVAQTFATLAHMFEGRIFIAVGIGEAMNERPLGFSWPNYNERSSRLVESVQIIRRLWTEDFVTFEGQYYRLRQANLYTKPKTPPKLYVAAIGRKSGRLAGMYSDGLYTLLMKREDYLEKLFPAFEAGAREVGKNPKDLDKMILLNISYNPDYDKSPGASQVLETCATSERVRQPNFRPSRNG